MSTRKVNDTEEPFPSQVWFSALSTVRFSFGASLSLFYLSHRVDPSSLLQVMLAQTRSRPSRKQAETDQLRCPQYSRFPLEHQYSFPDCCLPRDVVRRVSSCNFLVKSCECSTCRQGRLEHTKASGDREKKTTSLTRSTSKKQFICPAERR